jgi:hypothetical protein
MSANLAKSLYPGGIEANADADNFGKMLRQSFEATKARQPVFEAGFMYNGGFARVDILNPVGKVEWDIIEVKSSTEVKDVNLLDVAFQAYVYNGEGLKTRRCCVTHIDKAFTRHGPVDPSSFFKQADVTAKVSGLSREVEDQLSDMAKVIRQPACPDVRIGPHCDAPYTCPLHDQSWAFLPVQNVTTLYRGGKKAFKLLADGITSLTEIPNAEEPTGIGADDASSFCLQCLTDTEFVGLWL